MLSHIDRSALNTEELEQGLLGCILLNPHTWVSVVGKVRTEDFYNPVHGRIFSRIELIVDAGKQPDALTIKPFFDTDPDLESLGRGAYLASLVSNVVSIHNAAHYAETIRDMALRRRFIEIAQDAIRRASDPNEEFYTLMADVLSDLDRLSLGNSGAIRQSAVVESVIEDLMRTDKVDKTGIQALDEHGMRGGLYRGFTYSVAAKAKAGKTTLAHSISYNLNIAGVRHAYIALEMGSKQIVQRQIARHGGFNSLRFLEDKSNEFLTLATNTGMALPANCVYHYAPSLTFTELKSALSRMVLNDQINGYFLDYWQLVTGKEKGQTQEEHQAMVAQWLASFNAKHNVWGVIICQLNKDDNAFGGAGINRACDQFYKLHRSEISGCEHHAWLELEHSRYTYAGEIGSEMSPSLQHVTKVGPYITDFGDYA